MSKMVQYYCPLPEAFISQPWKRLCLTLQGVAQGFLLTQPLLSPSSQASLGLRGSHVWSCLQGEVPGQQSLGVRSVSLAV